MEETMYSDDIARPISRMRLYIGQNRAESDAVHNPEVTTDGGGHTDRQLDELLSAIIGNARLLKLEVPDLPESASRRLDIIAESAQRITALLPHSRGESVSEGDSGADTNR